MSKNNKKLMDLLYPDTRGGSMSQEGGAWGDNFVVSGILNAMANMLSSTPSGRRKDSGTTQFLRRKASSLWGRGKPMNKAQTLKALEREYQGSGKSIGGFIDFLLAPIKMIENGTKGKAWNYGLPGGPNADNKHGAGAEGGFGIGDVLFPIKMIENATKGDRWDKGIFGNGSYGGDHVELGGVKNKKTAKPKKKRQQSAKQKKRSALIKKLMKENPGLTLPQASHLIKKHGLMDQ